MKTRKEFTPGEKTMTRVVTVPAENSVTQDGPSNQGVCAGEGWTDSKAGLCAGMGTVPQELNPKAQEP